MPFYDSILPFPPCKTLLSLQQVSWTSSAMSCHYFLLFFLGDEIWRLLSCLARNDITLSRNGTFGSVLTQLWPYFDFICQFLDPSFLTANNFAPLKINSNYKQTYTIYTNQDTYTSK